MDQWIGDGELVMVHTNLVMGQMVVRHMFNGPDLVWVEVVMLHNAC